MKKVPHRRIHAAHTSCKPSIVYDRIIQPQIAVASSCTMVIINQ